MILSCLEKERNNFFLEGLKEGFPGFEESVLEGHFEERLSRGFPEMF